MTDGFNYARVNLEDVPDNLAATVGIEGDNPLSMLLTIGGRPIDYDAIRVVLYRNFRIVGSRLAAEALPQRVAARQWHQLLMSLARRTSSRWINDPIASETASDRVGQLVLARRLGFRVPDSMVTNDPDALDRFYERHHGDIVVKSLHHHRHEHNGVVSDFFTRQVTADDLSATSDIRCAPLMFQAREPHTRELRVTVVGDRTLAVELDLSAAGSVTDLHETDLGRLPKKHVGLARRISEACVEMRAQLGLVYAAVDFIIDDEDQLVFLEVNPAGDWGWVEHQSGAPITDAVVAQIEALL